jgi:multisubunit Na+/H+ antiporter MnhE subunit
VIARLGLALAGLILAACVVGLCSWLHMAKRWPAEFTYALAIVLLFLLTYALSVGVLHG